MSQRFKKIHRWLRFIVSANRAGQPQYEKYDGPLTEGQIEIIRKLAQSQCDPRSKVCSSIL